LSLGGVEGTGQLLASFGQLDKLLGVVGQVAYGALDLFRQWLAIVVK